MFFLLQDLFGDVFKIFAKVANLLSGENEFVMQYPMGTIYQKTWVFCFKMSLASALKTFTYKINFPPPSDKNLLTLAIQCWVQKKLAISLSSLQIQCLDQCLISTTTSSLRSESVCVLSSLVFLSLLTSTACLTEHLSLLDDYIQ